MNLILELRPDIERNLLVRPPRLFQPAVRSFLPGNRPTDPKQRG